MTSLLYDRVLSLISKPSRQRDDKAIENIIPWFQKHSQLFKNMKKETVMDIIRNCVFGKVEKDQIVIKQGEIGNCFYIILNGQVSVYINSVIDPDVEFGRYSPIQQLTSTKTGTTSDLPFATHDRTKYGSFMLSLNEGQSFGELALISSECVRNASVISDVTTDLVIVNRELYNRCIRESQEKEFNEKKDFVNSCSFFSNWQPKYKRSMAMSLVKMTTSYDGQVIRQGEPVKGLMFILRGNVKLVVDTSLHQLTQSRPISGATANPAKDIGRTVRPTRKLSFCRGTELCLAGPNELLGGVEVFMEIHSYLYSAISTEPTDLLLLDSKNYERLLIKKYPQTVELMRNSEETKLNYRISRLKNSNCMYLKNIADKMATKRLAQIRTNGAEKKTVNNIHFSRSRSLSQFGSSKEIESFIPKEGLLVDQYGPGTVFYRTRMREMARQRSRKKFYVSGEDTMEDSSGDDFQNSLPQTYETDCFDLEQKQDLYIHALDELSIGDMALNNLEQRIQIWQKNLGQQHSPRMIPMKRYEGNEVEPPKPGLKVVIHRRSMSPQDSELIHQHVGSSPSISSSGNTNQHDTSAAYKSPYSKDDFELLKSRLHQKEKSRKFKSNFSM